MEKPELDLGSIEWNMTLSVDYPEEKNLWLIRASIALQTDNTLKALNSLEIAIRLGDANEENLQVAAQLHMQNKNYDRALSLLEQNIAQGSIDMATVDKAVSWLQHEQQWGHAKKLLNKISKRLAELDDQKSAIIIYIKQHSQVEIRISLPPKNITHLPSKKTQQTVKR